MKETFEEKLKNKLLPFEEKNKDRKHITQIVYYAEVFGTYICNENNVVAFGKTSLTAGAPNIIISGSFLVSDIAKAIEGELK